MFICHIIVVSLEYTSVYGNEDCVDSRSRPTFETLESKVYGSVYLLNDFAAVLTFQSLYLWVNSCEIVKD